jgi:hypothetical protein
MSWIRHDLWQSRSASGGQARTVSVIPVSTLNIADYGFSVRMLSSPLREDKISGRIMPSDFLIRIGALRLPSPRASTKVEHILVPDGLLHPRFARSRTGLGAHVLCRRDGLPRLNERSALHRIIPHLRPHPHLAAQVSNALRLRVLHELEVLTTDLAYHPVGAHDAPLLRRLTRREFAAFRAGEPLPDLGAVAVLVVPPVNRDPVSKTRPERPSPMDPRPLVPEPEQPPAKRPHKALSALHEIASVNAPASQGPEAEGSWFKGFSPPHAAQVPLYNGAVLFPHRGQRAALHTALCALLKPDRKALWRRNEPTPGETKPHPVGMDRASHAFLLRSDADTVRRADSVPLAIALWRLRMWEGDAWETGAHVSQWDVTI